MISRRISREELHKAIVIVSEALSQLGVKFGIIGDAAVSLVVQALLSATCRGSENIGLIVQPDRKRDISANTVAQSLLSRFPMHFIQLNENGDMKLTVRVARGNAASEMFIELEILEAQTAIQRYNLDDESQARRIIIPVNSSFVTVLSPSWLLMDAIIRWYQSQFQPDGFEDLTEVICLLCAVPSKEIVSEENDFAVAVRAFTERYPNLREDLEEKIECSKI